MSQSALSSSIGGALGAHTGFHVEIERFQGPLDLLLHLIREQDIDIFDIPIARITDQFLQAVQGLGAGELDQAGEFLEMAATLVRIKAQMLLPRPQADEDEDPRAELVRRLLEFEQIREITQRLERSEAEWVRRFPRGYVPPRPRPEFDEVPLETGWEELYEAALEVEPPVIRDHSHRVTPHTISMEQKAMMILNALREESGIEFGRLLAPFDDRMHGVMTFLAGLELSRRRHILLRQVRPFDELWFYRREWEEGEGPGISEWYETAQIEAANGLRDDTDDAPQEELE